MRRPSPRFVFALLVAAFFGCIPARAATTVASTGDASIVHDEAAGTWTLNAGGTSLKLALDTGRDFAIVNLTTPSGVPWNLSSSPDTVLRVGEQTLAFGSRSAGFALQTVTTATAGDRVQLDATFDLASAGLQLTRHYAIAAGSPAFEVWTTYKPKANAKSIADLNALQLTIPAGAVRWINGLQGSAADVRNDAAFTLQQRTLASGETLALGGQGRSSEQTIPWFAVDGEQDEFFAALMWSGAWSLSIARGRTGLDVSFGLAPMTIAMKSTTAAFDGPHAVFGVVRGRLAEATAALRSYAVTGIRAGRPLIPLVTYNTWFAYGTAIDEGTIRGAMDRAAGLGTELFVIDAGWYAGAGANGLNDFESGLGSWTADPARFPNRLRPLSDYAHELGMKFGLWIEPERVNQSLVGAPGGLDESWLATHDGEYGSVEVGQICLGGRAGRTWMVNQLTALIDAVQPDYVKWDNNGWIDCDRDDHDHGAADGNFAHVSGLYQVFAALRERYPKLMIENVSGGGNRLDLGMLRYTEVAWMDDRTAPSIHVRHNVQGLSAVFPPAYLLAFVTNYDEEPLHAAQDMPMYMRSRMAAALGLCFRPEDLTEGDTADLMHQVDIYKSMRETISVAAASLLTPQATPENGPGWDVLQETSADGARILISAFQSDPSVDGTTVRLTGLQPTVSYRVESVDTGPLGEATGAELMTDGIEILRSPNTAAHILFLTVKQ